MYRASTAYREPPWAARPAAACRRPLVGVRGTSQIARTRFSSVPMTDPKLRAVLDDIHAQLARAEGLPPDQRHSLEELARELEALARHPPGEAGAADTATLRDRLSDSVRRLEASHPVLSTTLGNVVDALAFFGL